MKKNVLLLVAGLIVNSSALAVGAIAVDVSTATTEPAYGYSIGEPNRDAAQRSAMNFCRQRGTQCKVMVWFEACGAYATSRRYYGYGWGADKATATAGALKMCGRDSCEVVVAKCEHRGGGY